MLVNGSLPGPEIRVREGDLLRILVENRLADSPTSIHWHGILVPAGDGRRARHLERADRARQMYVYEYPIRQSGTYWYHSHYGFQEQRGCYGAFIIEPAHEPLRAERDAVILLGDWLHRSPADVFAQLRGRRAVPPARHDDGRRPSGGMKMDGSAVDAGMRMGMPSWRGMTMGAGGADLSDVKYDAFLLNGRGPTTRGRWRCAPANACACG